MQYPKVKSFPLVLFLSLNLCSASLNIGYVLTYLTLSIDTIFQTLNIVDPSEKTSVLSTINGVMPLGNFAGVFIGFLMGKKFTNKQCLVISDMIGMLSMVTLVAQLEVIIVFRFLLGVSNGIVSYIVPIYLKSICPEQYYVQFSMIFGYFLNLGVLVGQLMGIGYINWNGQGSNWWRVVFSVPPLLCLIRTINIFAFFNYDSPDQLFQRGRDEQAKNVLKALYKEEDLQLVIDKYKSIEKKNESFRHIFDSYNRLPLQIGVISMLVQVWCGSFAVFYYSAQIFKVLAKGELIKITIYTVCIGAFSVPAQFSTIAFIKYLGSKYTLVFGCFLLGIINFIIGSMSTSTEEDQLFVIFILLVLVVVVYGMTIGPVAWGLVPQINDGDGSFLVMEFRWGFQTILIFSFPYIVNSIGIMGAFYIFGAINILYSVYSFIRIKDTRGKTPKQIYEEYRQYEVMQNFQKSKQSLLQSQQTIEQEKFKKPELRSKVIAILVFINIALPSINFSFYLTTSIDWQHYNFIGPLSSFLGVIAGLYITNRFTTRIGIFMADIIGLLSISIIIPFAFNKNIDLLIGYLIIIGFANGISCVMIILYTKYLCPKQYYPFSAMFIGYCVMLGSILYSILGENLKNILPEYYQLFLLCVPLVFYLFRSLMILICFNYDSAVESLVKDNKQAALKVLQKFYYLQVIEREHDKCFFEAKRKPKVIFNQLFDVRYRIKVIIGLISMIVQVIIGLTFDMMYYSDRVDEISSFISLEGVPAILISVLISYHMGYRLTLYVGYLLISICFVVIYFVYQIQYAPQGLVILGFLIFSIVQPLQWLLATLLNDRDGIVFIFAFRWALESILVFVSTQTNLIGFFIRNTYIQASIAFLYVIFIIWKIKDNRNLDQEQYLEAYKVIVINN